jgi:hypothetical protein
LRQISWEDDRGYPNVAIEEWYQQGIACHQAGLSAHLKKQAFYSLSRKWGASGKNVRLEHARAFLIGATGSDSTGTRAILVPSDYAWPSPPDVSWQFVVCAYPDGECDLDYLHPVSRAFWSEDNGFLDPPPGPPGYFTRRWYKAMGFDVIDMYPSMQASVGPAVSHLVRVK